jgi:hypothetical protein
MNKNFTTFKGLRGLIAVLLVGFMFNLSFAATYYSKATGAQDISTVGFWKSSRDGFASNTLDISNLSNGLYLLTFESATTRATHKFVKN